MARSQRRTSFCACEKQVFVRCFKQGGSTQWQNRVRRRYEIVAIAASTASIDTNALVRLLVKDDLQQTNTALDLLSNFVARSETLFVSATVVLELEWVLRSCYRFKKADVLAIFATVMSSVELEFESEGAIEQALADYEEGNADFADYFHIAIAKKWDALPFMTFDVRASTAHGAKLLV